MFIETFLLVRSSNDRLARWTIEQVFKVVVDLTVTSFLTGIVALQIFIKHLMICFAQILLNKDDIILRSVTVDVFGREFSVVMRKTAFPLTH